MSRVRAARAANIELMRLYWSIDRDILDRQEAAGWGTKVVGRLAADLRAEFPDQRGWSRTNLMYMRRVAEVWPSKQSFVQQAVGQLPWGHVTVLLDRLSETELREWYAAQAAEHGWSRAVLENQIASHVHRRIGAAPSNFVEHLVPADSEVAQQLVRDPTSSTTWDLATASTNATSSRASWTSSRRSPRPLGGAPRLLGAVAQRD